MSKPELPQHIKGPFEVVSYQGEAVGHKVWLLRETRSGDEFIITSNTASLWPRERKPPRGSCIILSLDGVAMIGMHLATGIVFSEHAPPTNLAA